MVNSLIFMLIGIRGAYQDFTNLIIPIAIAIAIVIVLIGRTLAIYPLSALFSRSSLKVSFRLSFSNEKQSSLWPLVLWAFRYLFKA